MDAQTRYENMKDENRIKQIQVEQQNSLNAARLKGEIDEKMVKIKNQASEIANKHKQEELKIQNETLKLNKEYDLKNKQENNKHLENEHRLKIEEDKVRSENALKNTIENNKHQLNMQKLTN